MSRLWQSSTPGPPPLLTHSSADVYTSTSRHLLITRLGLFTGARVHTHGYADVPWIKLCPEITGSRKLHYNPTKLLTVKSIPLPLSSL